MRSDLPTLTRSLRAVAWESIQTASAMRVVSALVLVLAMSVPAAVLGISGRNIEAQGAILARVDEAGARILTVVSSADEGGIPATAVDRIAALGGVSWAMGLGPVVDVRNRRPTGEPTPARAFYAARAPVAFSAPSEMSGAFVSTASAARLGLGGAYSILDPGATLVVGWFSAADPLDDALEPFVLVPGDAEALVLERIIVTVDDVGWVELVAASLPSMIGTAAAEAATVERSLALLEARDAVRNEVALRDRALIAAMLVASMLLACVVVFAGTVSSRRDFGRRRALGATRAQLTLLVMLSTLWPSLLGAGLGTAFGSVYLASAIGRSPDPDFPVAVGVLTVLSLVVASAIPAAVAATRDPLRVLRVP